MEPLIYEPLQNSEIRLLSLKSFSLAQSEICCELIHAKLRNHPIYIALSYVWGNQKSVKPICVNGRGLEVTQNLYNALRSIKLSLTSIRESLKVPSSELLLWIDAICIDQRSKREKSEQVPRMGNIYSSSYTTLVWLGEVDDQSDQDRLQSFMCTWSSIIGDGLPSIDSPASRRVITELDKTERERFFDVYVSFVTNEWFGRIWIMQEYVLSPKQPYAIAGKYLLPLCFFLDILKVYNKEDPTASAQWGNVAHRLIQLHEARRQFGRIREMSLADQLLILLNVVAGGDCSKPHDYVYGILGATELTNLPRHLLPNYDIAFAQVFKDYSRYIIEQTGDLSILACYENHLEDVPRWVPDLRYGIIRRKSSKAGSVKFSADGSKLWANGVRVRKVLLHPAKCNPHTSHIRDFAQNFLTIAAQIRQKRLEDVFVEWVETVARHRSSPIKFAEHWNSVESCIEDFEDLKIDPDSQVSAVLHALKSEMSGNHQCLLENGDVTFCTLPRGFPKGESSVWVMSGSRNLLILTQTQDGYLYQGNVRYISGKLSHLCLEEAIILGDDVQEITLI